MATTGGNTVLTTTQASLTDAFDSLKVVDTLPFSQATIGDIQSSVPGLSFKWVSGTAATQSVRPSRTLDPGVSFNTLQLSFAGLSLSTSHGIAVGGSANLQTSPVLQLTSHGFPPQIDHFRVGFNAFFTGSIAVTSTYGGDLTYSNAWFDGDIGPPQPFGFLVFVPHLRVESSISGVASGSIAHTQTFNASASPFVNYDAVPGWSSGTPFTTSFTATESGVDAAFGITVVPVSVTLSYNLYDIVGPYGEYDIEFTATGTHTVENGIEGIDADVASAGGGAVGMSVSTPEALSKLFQASWTPITATFEFNHADLFHHFFPFTTAASIVVGDNGPAPDDIFRVAVDGVTLGQTDKGGTGGFRVNEIVPGPHTLTITCLDDGANGRDIGTLGITLANGFTFADHTMALSDLLSLNQVKNYTIIAPTAPSHTLIADAAVLPPSQIRTEHPAEGASRPSVTKR